MNFWVGLALVAGAHVIVNLWLQPRIEARWQAASASAKVAKAGTLAALQTAGDFLRVAAITFGMLAVLFLVLQWAAPAASLDVLAGLQAAALETHDRAKAASGWIAQGLFWLGLAGAFVIAWALTFETYGQKLAVEYVRQLRALVLSEREGALVPLPATAEMLALAERPDAEGLSAERRAHRLRYLDLVRRIDLSKQVLPLEADSARGRLLRLLFSEGMVETGKNSTKRLGKVAAAATCVLMIGTAAPALRSGLVEPALDTFANLRIERALGAERARLAAVAQAPSPAPAADDPDYLAAAEAFLDALAEDSPWITASARIADRAIPSAGERRMMNAAFARMVARDSVVQSYANDPASGTRAFALDDLSAGDPGRAVLEEMRRRQVGPSALRAAAVARLEETLRKAGRTVPGFRENLKRSLEGFNRPARLSTFATMALSDQFALAAQAAFPGPGGGDAVLAGEGAKAGRKGLQKSFEQIVQIRFAGFLNDIAAGRPLGSALARVRGEGLETLLRRGDAAGVAALIEEADARRDAFLSRGFTRPAVLAKQVDPAEARAASEALAEGDWRQRVSLLAQYDDLLPGTALSLPTPLGLAAAGAGRPREAFPSPVSIRAVGGARLSKVKMRGGSLVGVALTAASLAVAAGEESEASPDELRIDGITLGFDLALLDYRASGLSWRSGPDGITLRAKESGILLVPRRPVDPAVVRAALAIAADGRPAVLIAEPVPRAQMRRWLLHPVIEDTPLGAEFITLYAGSGLRELQAILARNTSSALLSREAHDFLSLATMFRAAFKGQVDIDPLALVRLAREVEGQRLARVPTSRTGPLR
ncbi:MAG: hypothetical protein ACKO01_12790 [Erythrobacter sp.]